MKVTAELVIDIQNGKFSECISRLSAAGCEIQRSEIISHDQKSARYNMDLVYSDSAEFKRCITAFSESGHYVVQKVRNCLEDILSGGFIEIRNAMKIETPADYEMNVLGVARIAIEKISESDNPSSATSVWKNVGIIAGMKDKTGQGKSRHYAAYAESEIMAAVLSKFTGKNGYPLISRYDLTEDFLKILSSLEPTFSAYRITSTDDDDNPDIYEQIRNTVTIPTFSRYGDELPVLILAAIIKMASKHRFRIKDSAVGFIGLNVSAIKLSHICSRMGFMRVLGFDNNEKNMLNFERSGGLATIPEHILGNSDILVIIKPQFSEADLVKARPGMILLSLVDDHVMIGPFEKKRICREIVSGEWSDSSILIPGILSGMFSSGKTFIEDKDLIAISELLATSPTEEGRIFPSVFSDIHTKIEEVLNRPPTKPS
jgi:hypothetical protein